MEQTNKNEYRTGDTRPPKNHRGIIAFLLVAVILLCGVVSALGMMNIRLWQQLQEQADTQLHFSQPIQLTLAKTCADTHGFSGQGVSSFWQTYSHLPAGVYVTHVDPGSAAWAAGLRQGDVVLCVDGYPVQNMQAVENCLHNKTGTVPVQLSRNGHLMVLDLSLPEE